MANYYWSSTGAEINAGTIGAPKLYAKSAIALATAPGDFAYGRAGTYTGPNNRIDSTDFTIAGGTSGNPITISAYPGETVTLRVDDGLHAVRLSTNTQTYVTIQDIILDGVNMTVEYDGAYIDSGPYNILQRVEVKNFLGFGIASSINNGNPHHLTIRDCSIHNNGVATGAATNGHGIYSQATYAVIEGCDIYDNYGYGIHLYANGTNDTDNSTIRWNFVSDNGARPATTAYNILVSHGANTLVYSNIVEQTDARTNLGGVLVYAYAANAQLYNNTIVGHGYDAITLQNYTSAPVIKNNIIYGNASTIVDASGTGTPVQSNNITGNPSFVGGTDYHLQSGSIAIGAGANLTSAGVLLDYDGETYTVPYDCGAFMYVTSSGSTGAPSITGPVLLMLAGRSNLTPSLYRTTTAVSGGWTSVTAFIPDSTVAAVPMFGRIS